MLTMRQKKAVTTEVQDIYRKANKKDKGKILDEFSATTGYNRVYAARILRLSSGKTIRYSKINGRKIKYIIGKGKKVKRVRDSIYGYDVFLALKKIWKIFDFICSRRLKPFMAEAIEKLQKHKELELTPETKQKLLAISVSTIDRC